MNAVQDLLETIDAVQDLGFKPSISEAEEAFREMMETDQGDHFDPCGNCCVHSFDHTESDPFASLDRFYPAYLQS